MNLFRLLSVVRGLSVDARRGRGPRSYACALNYVRLEALVMLIEVVYWSESPDSGSIYSLKVGRSGALGGVPGLPRSVRTGSL